MPPRPRRAGRRWRSPFSFEFTTPTVRLLQADWYRRGKRYDKPVVLLLRFNQPVSAAGLLPHLTLERAPHAWSAPFLPSAGLPEALAADPRAPEAFAAKVAAASAAAGSRAPVAVHPARDWDKKQFPPSEDLLVLETTEVPPPDTWIRIVVGPSARGVQGSETPGRRSRGRSSWSRRFSSRASGARSPATPTSTTRCGSAAACSFPRRVARSVRSTLPIPAAPSPWRGRSRRPPPTRTRVKATR